MTLNDFNEVKNLDQWRGYVVRALEDLCKDTIANKESINNIDSKITDLADAFTEKFLAMSNQLSELNVKSGVWGAIGGLVPVVLAIVIWLITTRHTPV